MALLEGDEFVRGILEPAGLTLADMRSRQVASYRRLQVPLSDARSFISGRNGYASPLLLHVERFDVEEEYSKSGTLRSLCSFSWALCAVKEMLFEFDFVFMAGHALHRSIELQPPPSVFSASQPGKPPRSTARDEVDLMEAGQLSVPEQAASVRSNSSTDSWKTALERFSGRLSQESEGSPPPRSNLGSRRGSIISQAGSDMIEAANGPATSEVLQKRIGLPALRTVSDGDMAQRRAADAAASISGRGKDAGADEELCVLQNGAGADGATAVSSGKENARPNSANMALVLSAAAALSGVTD
jgi:hypothetical protein